MIESVTGANKEEDPGPARPPGDHTPPRSATSEPEKTDRAERPLSSEYGSPEGLAAASAAATFLSAVVYLSPRLSAAHICRHLVVFFFLFRTSASISCCCCCCCGLKILSVWLISKSCLQTERESLRTNVILEGCLRRPLPSPLLVSNH